MFLRLLPQTSSPRGGRSAWSAPWRSSHARLDLTSVVPGRPRKRRGSQMQSAPMQHHWCLREEENIPPGVRRIGNDAAPVLGILLEGVPLKGIDLVADKASDLH